ncbi:MAG: tRNA pseudouridine(55) synthase TruB [Candidatus Hydrogenedentales bacterium]
MKGILLVDKSAGMTSHDVVDRIRKAAGMRRIGHTGTLDPNATGLLILCLGPATRLSEHLTGLDKVYEGDLRLGITTDSHDITGQVLEEKPVPADLTADAVEAVFQKFTGDILQVPPMVSAVKVGGERLYKLARKGETVVREPRPVTVHEFKLLRFDPPLVGFRVGCTSGTYVRSLCHEVGQRLGCGATLNSLRRTAVGRHTVAQAAPVEAFNTRADVEQRLMPIEDALDLPQVVLRPGGRRLIASGSPITPRDLKEDCPVSAGWVQLKSDKGELLALGQVQQSATAISIVPRRVFVSPHQ